MGNSVCSGFFLICQINYTPTHVFYTFTYPSFSTQTCTTDIKFGEWNFVIFLQLTEAQLYTMKTPVIKHTFIWFHSLCLRGIPIS